MKAILVWGASGFIGRHLAAHLRSRGFAVTALTRREVNEERFWSAPPTIVCIPSSDVERLADLISRSDLIFNLAGTSGAVASNLDVESSLEGNCRIQASFLRACELAGNRPHVVFASSRLVYGSPGMTPVPESAPCQPQSAYAAHKFCIENYHSIAGIRGKITYTICRISNPYGFYDRGFECGYGFINDLIQRGLAGSPLTIFGDGRQLRDYIHISDLLKALELCGVHPDARQQTFNVGCGEGLSIRDAAKNICDLTHSSITHLPWPCEYALAESGDFVADISKIRNLLGFEPQFRFSEGIREVLRTTEREQRRSIGLNQQLTEVATRG